ncbi:hypothetical protein Hdeb2414_s0453g00897091 [Helianthus debilis subsp. tardiflorus]
MEEEPTMASGRPPAGLLTPVTHLAGDDHCGVSRRRGFPPTGCSVVKEREPPATYDGAMVVLRRHTSFGTFTTIFYRSRTNDDDGCFQPPPFVVYAENPRYDLFFRAKCCRLNSR